MALLHAVRTALKDKSVRVSDLFKDYDPLRVGYITRSQFVRFARTRTESALPAE